MEGASPARLYATLVGALLVVGGIVGFFYSASFGSPGDVGEMLGFVAVNGWLNALHVLSGAIALLVAGFASRRCALWLGGLYLLLAVWGFAAGSGEAILGLLPVSSGGNLVHLALAALGLAAALTTARRTDEPAEPAQSASAGLRLGSRPGG